MTFKYQKSSGGKVELVNQDLLCKIVLLVQIHRLF